MNLLLPGQIGHWKGISTSVDGPNQIKLQEAKKIRAREVCLQLHFYGVKTILWKVH
jgi:hypothetical protein